MFVNLIPNFCARRTVIQTFRTHGNLDAARYAMPGLLNHIEKIPAIRSDL